VERGQHNNVGLGAIQAIDANKRRPLALT